MTEPPTIETPIYSSQAVADAAGISYRTVDYWTRTGLITPLGEVNPGSGQSRGYSSAQAARAVLLARCVRAGLRHDKSANLIDNLGLDEVVLVLAHLERAA